MLDELIGGFDEEVFCRFLNAKFSGSFSASRGKIPVPDGFPWESAERLGVVKTLAGPSGANMPLLVVVAKLHDGETLKERSSRIKQFKFAKQVLDDAMSNPAPGVDGVLTQGLFVFYDDAGNFRLSLVYGKADGTKLVWSTAKRLSFHVQAGDGNKTFRNRMDLDWSTFDKLKDAFSVEKLTREFYTRLFAWYQRAMESDKVIFPNDIVKDKEPGEVKSEQIIRLITRLMFVWFLKQKQLVPYALFVPETLAGILKKFDPENGENYYRAILQNLFFATLNTEIGEREFAVEGSRKENEEHFGVKIFYRYAAEFSLSEKKVVQLFSGIPFLNGGLFECLDRDNHYYDGFSRRKSKRAQMPNALFFDDKGLIPLLQQYNFTVEENSPGDEEVALDPEMLGKVFENLLGAYNPETKVAARNATGSFYTPREIVNYKVNESLIAYLTGKCGDENAVVIRKLFTDGECPADKKLCAALDKALVSAKILDPACGSGAFPMGILLRMVELLRILRDIPEESSVYNLKLELIENCIYGGDIQCIAVQISKLRFFISLVCEQKPTDDPKENYGIHTLPNLETKFVAANSLIGLPEAGKDVLDLCTGEIAELKEQLFEVRHRHFSARSYQEKQQLRREDRQLRAKIKRTVKRDVKSDRKHLGLLIKEREKVAEPKWVAEKPKPKAIEMFSEFSAADTAPQGQFDENAKRRKQLDAEIAREQQKVNLPTTVVDEIAELLASWDPYDQNTSAPFSDPEWMFNVKGGFDVVIGNPPYLQIQKLPEKTKTDLVNQEYKTFSKSADMYCLFYERGIQMLSAGGHLCYITSNKWMRAEYGKKIRGYFTKFNPKVLIDLGPDVFESATVDTNILLIQKTVNERTTVAIAIRKESRNGEPPDLNRMLERDGFILTGLDERAWSVGSKVEIALKEKIKRLGKPLKEWNVNVYRGILTGLNEAFIIDQKTRDRLIAEDPQSEKILKPLLKGSTIKKYTISWDGRYLLNIHNGHKSSKCPPVDISRFPAVKDHIDNTVDALSKGSLSRRGGHKGKNKNFYNRSDRGLTPYNLRDCAYIKKFDDPKLIWKQTSTDQTFVYDEEGYFLDVSGQMMTSVENDACLLKYLLAFLNSNLAKYLLHQSATLFGTHGIRWIPSFITELNICSVGEDVRKPFIMCVDRILSAKKSDPTADTTALEAEIDQLVYELYMMTPEEIAIVEGSTEVSGCAGGAASGQRAEMRQQKSEVSEAPTKKTVRKRKPKLPPSLEGWD